MAKRTRLRRNKKKTGWTNAQGVKFTNAQVDSMRETNKRLERHNKVMEYANEVLLGNNKLSPTGEELSKYQFLDYRDVKTQDGAKGLMRSMNKFNKSLDKYGNYQQKQFMDNFKRSLVQDSGMSPQSPQMKSILSKLNQLSPLEFDSLARVNPMFTITYQYYDDSKGVSNLEEVLDEYLKSEERKKIRTLVNRRKI